MLVGLRGSAWTLAGSVLGNRKITALIAYRLEQQEQMVSKHNTLVERSYKLEAHLAVVGESIKVANHRIADLERDVHNIIGQG